MSEKRPAFQFYPADWRKDLELQSCSIAARGLWHEMMCVMHEAVPYGHLVLNGKPMTDIQAATACRVTPQAYRSLIAELKAAGVPGETPEGMIFSRRMVRDEETRNARAEGGKAGGEHGQKGAEHGRKGGRPKKETGVKKPPLNPPPSSSSSSSASTVEAAQRSRGSRLPEGWTPNFELQTWAIKERADLDPTATLERFRDHWRAAPGSRGVKLDWDATFRNWVRNEKPGPKISLASVPAQTDVGTCPCGAKATVKVGGKPRCGAHVRGLEEAA